MTRFLPVLVAGCVLLPAAALAQAKVLEDKKAEKYNEIERGVFLEANFGYFGVLNPPAQASSKSYFSGGQAVMVSAGLDIGERISPALFFMGSANRMGSDYTGFSTKQQPASGDFSAMVPGATIKARFVGFADSQDVSRVWLYGRASIGYVLYAPSALLPNPDVVIMVGPGVEYFTRLRHFSIGLEATFNFYALTGSMGFSVFPSVRYAF